MKKKNALLQPSTSITASVAKTEFSDELVVSLIDYNSTDYSEKTSHDLNDFVCCHNPETVSWLNVDGLHNDAIVHQIGARFGLHALLIEDVLNVEERPKTEDFGEYLFFTLKALEYNTETQKIESEQISFVLSDHYVLSFQEAAGGDLFDPVRDRLRLSKGKLRFAKADYLVYRLVDTVVDNYFLILDHVSERLLLLEDTLLKENETRETSLQIQRIKKQMIFLRKSLIPLRQAVYDLKHAPESLIAKETHNYFNDVYDHILQVIEEIESNQSILSSLTEMFQSNQSNRMNAIMKVLTVVSSVFIPLTFIAGVYGMNFENMPELKTTNGYFYTWAVMGLTALFMVSWFKYKKWI